MDNISQKVVGLEFKINQLQSSTIKTAAIPDYADAGETTSWSLTPAIVFLYEAGFQLGRPPNGRHSLRSGRLNAAGQKF